MSYTTWLWTVGGSCSVAVAKSGQKHKKIATQKNGDVSLYLNDVKMFISFDTVRIKLTYAV